ncbi:hypothetical protein CVAR21S_00669 [Corynebacterium variabile]
MSQPPAASPNHTYADDLNLALNIANAADAITMDRFGAGDLEVHAKPDLTPVTDADTATEQKVRDLISTHRPRTPSWARSSAAMPERPDASGWWTPSTAPRTTSAAFRCGPH